MNGRNYLRVSNALWFSAFLVVCLRPMWGPQSWAILVANALAAAAVPARWMEATSRRRDPTHPIFSKWVELSLSFALWGLVGIVAIALNEHRALPVVNPPPGLARGAAMAGALAVYGAAVAAGFALYSINREREHRRRDSAAAKARAELLRWQRLVLLAEDDLSIIGDPKQKADDKLFASERLALTSVELETLTESFGATEDVTSDLFEAAIQDPNSGMAIRSHLDKIAESLDSSGASLGDDLENENQAAIEQAVATQNAAARRRQDLTQRVMLVSKRLDDPHPAARAAVYSRSLPALLSDDEDRPQFPIRQNVLSEPGAGMFLYVLGWSVLGVSLVAALAMALFWPTMSDFWRQSVSTTGAVIGATILSIYGIAMETAVRLIENQAEVAVANAGRLEVVLDHLCAVQTNGTFYCHPTANSIDADSDPKALEALWDAAKHHATWLDCPSVSCNVILGDGHDGVVARATYQEFAWDQGFEATFAPLGLGVKDKEWIMGADLVPRKVVLITTQTDGYALLISGGPQTSNHAIYRPTKGSWQHYLCRFAPLDIKRAENLRLPAVRLHHMLTAAGVSEAVMAPIATWAKHHFALAARPADFEEWTAKTINGLQELQDRRCTPLSDLVNLPDASSMLGAAIDSAHGEKNLERTR